MVSWTENKVALPLDLFWSEPLWRTINFCWPTDKCMLVQASLFIFHLCLYTHCYHHFIEWGIREKERESSSGRVTWRVNEESEQARQLVNQRNNIIFWLFHTGYISTKIHTATLPCCHMCSHCLIQAPPTLSSPCLFTTGSCQMAYITPLHYALSIQENVSYSTIKEVLCPVVVQLSVWKKTLYLCLN